MRALAWTATARIIDGWRKDAPPRGRHRKNVSSTHVPAYPFNKPVTEREWLGWS